MTLPLVLASTSETRLQMLRNAGVVAEPVPARIDEVSVRNAMTSEGARPRDIADALAEQKARKVAAKLPERLVLGSDQVLSFQGQVLGKPESPDVLLSQLTAMAGQEHRLISAAVIYDQNRPVWRFVSEVRLHMRSMSEAYLRDYIERNWDDIRHSAGGYLIEAEGARLFGKIDGDYFTILGLPLLQVLGYLTDRGHLPG